MRTALVLGAGGLTGQAFHLGVLTALQEIAGFDGRRAAVVVGTSAGSLVAAGLAGGLSAHDQLAVLSGEPVSAEGRALLRASRARAGAPPAEPPEELRARPLAPRAVLAAARRPWSVRPGAVVSSLLPPGRTSTESISRQLHKLHGQHWPDNLRVCAVRARDARRVVFGAPGAPRADVGAAVAASCAIPGYFAPVRIGGEHYVDGGGHSPTNADSVLRESQPEPPGLVVVSSPMSFGPGAGRTADAGLRFVVRRYLAREVRTLRRRGATVLVFQPTADDLAAMGLHPMRLLRADRVVEAVGHSVRARLEAQPALAEALQTG